MAKASAAASSCRRAPPICLLHLKETVNNRVMEPCQFPVARLWQLWSSVAAYLGTTVLAAFAFVQYKRSKQVERSKWMLQLYEKFYEEPRFKRMRDILDCDRDEEPAVQHAVEQEEAEFTDYLNFFEFVGYLRNRGQLDDKDIDALFGYYLDCLNAQTPVRTYVHDASRGFEYLSLALKKRKDPRT